MAGETDVLSDVSDLNCCICGGSARKNKFKCANDKCCHVIHVKCHDLVLKFFQIEKLDKWRCKNCLSDTVSSKKECKTYETHDRCDQVLLHKEIECLQRERVLVDKSVMNLQHIIDLQKQLLESAGTKTVTSAKKLLNNINSASHHVKTAVNSTIHASKKTDDSSTTKNTCLPGFNKNTGQLIKEQNTVIPKQLTKTSNVNIDTLPTMCDISDFTQQNVSKVLHEVHAQSTMEKYININKDEERKTIQRKRNQRRDYVVGNNADINKIKGVPKYVFLHVCRVDPTTTLQDLKDQLKEVFPEVTCEVINSKHPNVYSSFKVGLYERNFKTAMNPELWPNGAYISRFLPHRQRTNLPPT